MRNSKKILLILVLLIHSNLIAQTVGWVRVGGFYPNTSLSESYDDKYLIDDINGDNFPEIAISGCRTSGYFVKFYWGGPGSIDTLPDFEITYPYSGTGFEDFRAPYAVPELGDVNGDDFGDLGIRMPRYTDEWSTFYCGKVFLYWGGPSLDTICDWSYSDPSGFYQNLGTDLVGVGDWNSDGYDDFAISAPSGWEAYGKIYFFLGGNPPSSTPSKIWQGDTLLYRLGTTLISGNFTADSLLDLMWISPTEGETTYIYKVEYLIGSDTFETTEPIEIFEQNTDYTHTDSWSLHLLGDINNDGYDDLWLQTLAMREMPDFENGCHLLLGGEDSITHVVLDSAEWFGKNLYGITTVPKN